MSIHYCIFTTVVFVVIANNAARGNASGNRANKEANMERVHLSHLGKTRSSYLVSVSIFEAIILSVVILEFSVLPQVLPPAFIQQLCLNRSVSDRGM